VIDKDGAQQASSSYNDPGSCRSHPCAAQAGTWLRLEIALAGYRSGCAPGRSRSAESSFPAGQNDAANFRAPRDYQRLYGGGPELRLKQNCFWDWRMAALAASDPPDVCHLNEGCAFAVLERARVSWKNRQPSKSPWPSRERATSSPPTRGGCRLGPGFAPPLSCNTLLGMPSGSSAYHSTICWPWPPESERRIGEFHMAYLANPGSGR